ncbi:NADH-quinone oxidoreductase subunit B family protein [Clostridium lundense]|uniref:NADH-quinone oxidoreductase subunit B family protein n=1 Tax=Clostridium lundense TaxID=319475 RepID=UPI0004847A43|nr:NADH-quinone oxidoreductase subunit B family protein [Clostridium lundense]
MEKLLRWSRSKSPWIYHLNTGSCNGCDIELMALLGPRYDLERFGVKLTGTPKHADIVVVTGPVTTQSKDRMLRILSQIPEPKVVVSLGSCPMSCNVFKGSYCVEGPLDKWTHVDVSVGGCPPKPEAIIEGILQAVELLRQKDGEDKRG